MANGDNLSNEEPSQGMAGRDAERARYFTLYDLAPVGYLVLDEQGLILEANLAAAKLLGADRAELEGKPFSRFLSGNDKDIQKQFLVASEPQSFEPRMTKNDGTTFWARLDAAVMMDKDGLTVSHVALADITERKFREEEHNLATRLILTVTLPGDFRECMANMTATLQRWSGCEAVGIRLREGDDFPYYETRGFPAKFVEMENHLCAYGPDGKILRDSVGNPVHECMCGNVLCRRFDPSKSFFSAHGSFWCNNTTALLASTTEADRQTRTRNRCNGEGYESVALIPLRAGDQVFGLLQFNDHRTNRFTPELIAHFETLADSLALALSRRKVVEELRESETRFRSYFELPLHGVAITSPDDNRWLQVNDELCAILGYAREEIVRHTWVELTHPDDLAADLAQLRHVLAGEIEHYKMEKRFIRKDGGIVWTALSVGCARKPDGAPDYVVCVMDDITMRKQAEEVLNNTVEELRRFHSLTVGRELAMIELKKEVNALLGQSGREAKYRIAV